MYLCGVWCLDIMWRCVKRSAGVIAVEWAGG